ncbi:MAG: peptidase S41 [Proteobacteria bacterium]|nr:peptidase S41 [Pseudomonadota bacterium]
MTRRALCAAAVCAAAPAFATEPPTSVVFADDFDEFWRTLDQRYCYFGEKRTDWQRVRRVYRPQALAAASTEAFARVLTRACAELYDPHTHLVDAPDGTARFPLYDLLAERRDADVYIAEIKDGSSAQCAELGIGDCVVAIDGVPIAEAVTERAPTCMTRADPMADWYAINSAVAGKRGMARSIVVRGAASVDRTVPLPVIQQASAPNVESRAIQSGLGYIRIRTFADMAVVDTFDAALAALRATRGLILDVRDNGGGDTAVGRPIMGRFISDRKPYAFMRRRAGRGLTPHWTEYVDPRGPFTYDKPVVVLANHWSASMAEGFPMGMRDIGRARIVGTRMLGVGAAVFNLRLDLTGIDIQYSAEPVFDTNDVPRALLRPDVETAPGADILAAGVEELRRQIAE